MPRLTISSPDGKRGMLELTRPVLTIGRGAANDLVLNDSSVSRFHAVLKLLDSGDVCIADRGSTNGVLVNGARIDDEVLLHNGDVIAIGIYTARLESVDVRDLIVQKNELPYGVHAVLQRAAKAAAAPVPPPPPPESQSSVLELVRKLQRENYLLSVLYDAGRALSSKLSIGDISEQVMSLAFRIEGVERGFIMLFNDAGEVTSQTEVRYRDTPGGPAAEQPQIVLGRSILQRVREEKQPILISDARADERFSGSESMKISGLRSAMVAPLVSSDERLLGLLYVDNLEKAAAFTQEELNVLSLVAAQAAAAMDAARAHQQLAQQAVQRSALERFLAPEVVEMIAADPEGIRLGGVNQKVSVMFADIRNFTSISERMPPERVVEILNEFFTRITDVIFDYGGTLDKYLGDGVMALFGAPISKGNDALNAVKCAMAIQRLMQELNRDCAARKWPEFRVGIGINSGIVTAGNIGSPRRIDYTVVGDTVNVAARLMAHASGGQILISRPTAWELDSSFQVTPLAPLLAKGKSEPVQVFSVRWSASAAHSAAAAAT